MIGRSKSGELTANKREKEVKELLYLLCLFFRLIFIGVLLLYNVVLVSAILKT